MMADHKGYQLLALELFYSVCQSFTDSHENQFICFHQQLPWVVLMAELTLRIRVKNNERENFQDKKTFTVTAVF